MYFGETFYNVDLYALIFPFMEDLSKCLLNRLF